MAFATSSVLLLDNTGSVSSYLTNQSSPVTLAIPAGSTGTWTWVVSRAGYSTQIGTIDATGGGLFSASPAPTERIQPSGITMYTNSTDSNLAVSFDLTSGSERCFIDIGDATVSPQAILDEVEDALETEDGCRFLAATLGSECTFAGLASGDFLFMGPGYRIRRASLGDVNATVAAFCISTDGVVVDGSNGSVAFLSSNLTADDVASAVLDALLSSHTISGSVGEALGTISSLATTSDVAATPSSVRTELSTELGRIDVAISSRSSHSEPDLSNLDVAVSTRLADSAYAAPLDAAGIRSSIGMSSANLDTQLSTIDTNIDSVLIDTSTTIPNQISSSIAPTPTEVASAVRTELTTELNRIDVNISSRSNHSEPDLSNLDVAISSRLASSSYSAPLDASAIRSAVGLASASLDIQLAAIDSNIDEILNDTSITIPTTLNSLSTHTAADVWSVSIKEITGGQVDTIAGTIQTLDQLDIAQDSQHILTRNLVSSGSGESATPSEIASAVRTELTTELNRIDVNISSRSNHSEPDLSNLDVAVSSRLASSSYVIPLSSSQVEDIVSSTLDTYDSPTLTEMTNAFNEIKGVTWSSSTDTLEAIRDRGDSSWVTAINFSTHSVSDIWSNSSRTITGGKIDAISGSISTLDELDVSQNIQHNITQNNIASLDFASGSIPDADEIASAVRTELTTELDRIDVDVSSRLASSSYIAPLDSEDIRLAIGLAAANLDQQLDNISSSVGYILIDTATNLPSQITSLNNPSSTDIASAVRDELTTELSRIDVDVSSRLASSSYVEPPSVTDIQSSSLAAINSYAPSTHNASDVYSAMSGSLGVINEGVKKSSLLIPHSEDI